MVQGTSLDLLWTLHCAACVGKAMWWGGQRLAQTTWSKREAGWATEALSALELVAWLAHSLGWPWTSLLKSFSSVNPAGEFVWGWRNTKMTLKSNLCPCIALSRVNKSYPNIPPSPPPGVSSVSFVEPCGKAWMQHKLHKWYTCIFKYSAMFVHLSKRVYSTDHCIICVRSAN